MGPRGPAHPGRWRGRGACGSSRALRSVQRPVGLLAERTAENSGGAGTKRSSCAAPSLLSSRPYLSLARTRGDRREAQEAPALAPPRRRIRHGAGRSPRLALPSGSFVRSLAPWPHSASALGNPSRLLDPIRWRLPRLVRVVCMGSLVDVFWEFFHGAAVADGSGCLCRMHCLVCKGESSVLSLDW